MHTQVGVVNTTTSGVLSSQTHTHISAWILLDSQSSVDCFMNPSLVRDIHYCKESQMLVKA